MSDPNNSVHQNRGGGMMNERCRGAKVNDDVGMCLKVRSVMVDD
jgi:hypothetical protein